MSISMTIKETYIQEGIQIGELRGEQKSRLEIAHNLLNAGFSLNDARKFTQLSDEETRLLNATTAQK